MKNIQVIKNNSGYKITTDTKLIVYTSDYESAMRLAYAFLPENTKKIKFIQQKNN